MYEITRRPYLTEPGESLFLARSPIETALRFGAFVRDTGLSGSEVSTSALCAVPIPLYQDFAERRRWAGTRIEMMWHPLLWLPEHLQGPQTLVFNGEPYEEPWDFYVTRLCIELEVSGIYDPESGTWLNVLSLAGLNIDEEMTQARLKRWMSGARDDRLDALTLEPHIRDNQDPDWAYDRSGELTEGLIQMSWAISAKSLAEALEDLTIGEVSEDAVNDETVSDEDYVWSPGQRQQVASQIVALGATSLDGASQFSWLDAADDIRGWEGTEAELLEGPVAGARALLEMIAEEFEPTPDELASAEEAETDEVVIAEKPWERVQNVAPAGDVDAEIITEGNRRGGMDFR